MANGDFFQLKLRDVVEFLVVIVGVILWLTGGFSKGDTNTHDLVLLTNTVATLTLAVHEAEKTNIEQSKDISQNQGQIKELQTNYKALYDVSSDVKNKIDNFLNSRK